MAAVNEGLECVRDRSESVLREALRSDDPRRMEEDTAIYFVRDDIRRLIERLRTRRLSAFPHLARFESSLGRASMRCKATNWDVVRHGFETSGCACSCGQG